MCVCVTVRAEVDNYIGIDYSLLSDPVVTERSLDMDFRVSVVCTYKSALIYLNIVLIHFIKYT